MLYKFSSLQGGGLAAINFRQILVLLLFVVAAGPLLFRGPEEKILSDAVVEKQIPVLMYHKVSPYSFHGGPGLRVTPRAFRKQMNYLYKQGYTAVSLDQLADHWQTKAALPSRPIIITFDDGYEDNYTFAFPVLQKYNYNATIFLVYDEIGGYNIWDDKVNVAHNIKLLTWEEIDVMKNKGITFGSHTLTHPDLTQITPDSARHEIYESKKKLEERLGTAVNFMAYPYGRRNSIVDQAVRNAGYRGAVTTEWGKNTVSTDPVHLKRLRITGRTTIKDFEQILDGKSL